MDRIEAGSCGTSEGELRRLIERIAKLERQNRRWKLGGAVAAVALALAMAVGARAQKEREDMVRARYIEAESFVLKDAAGVKRGELTLRNGVPVLDFYGADGTVVWSTTPRIVTQGH